MRRLWTIIVGLGLLGIVAWNLLTGQPAFGGNLPGAALLAIAFTLVQQHESGGYSS